jgi:hypothetical protein
MPTVRTFRGRIAGQAQLSLGAHAFLRDDEYDPALGGLLFPANEHAWLLDHDDEPYVLYGDAARQVSGKSARELVTEYGDVYLKAFQREHGPGEFPAWHYRFNGGDDADGE